ncbi:conserved hypothetical protein [uncultured Desulfobacterium sp.]|uniref:PKS/mFAS DH domain-containing protein n=1 Tax=uncultured Desulfobacterium sp. TaxID=201089 RepID=A0A445MZG6_9BACT|nr:conserved hypothetical protein [uncultured Desulfobacterium sp.]
MEGLPQIKANIHKPVDIAVFPYMMDHRFMGHAVLPAVEAMQVLAAFVKEARPDANVTFLTEAKFAKFLYIKPGSEFIAAFADISIYENGDVIASLITKTTSQKSRITRTKEHAAIRFPGSVMHIPQIPLDITASLEGISFDIQAERIYSDLVLFGPAYHNIKGLLHVSYDGAIAEISSPIKPGNDENELLGSPFILDAAFHAACVWGQRFRRIVAFPVGVERRMVFKQTGPDQLFFCRIIPVMTESDFLVFDAWIYDSDGTLFEAVSGIQMRDVSGGAMKPPQWVVADTGHGE